MNVVLIRHAERDSSGHDALSAAGRKRAQLLVSMFREAGVSALFTSEFTRTKQTAEPLAQALAITPREIASDLDAARDQIRDGGALSIVVGHSDTVPLLIGALGGPPDLQIQDDEFDRMFVVGVGPDAVSTVSFRYVSV
jgi:broad specificity phosphatase PhoE